jgi:hypothetical protein
MKAPLLLSAAVRSIRRAAIGALVPAVLVCCSADESGGDNGSSGEPAEPTLEEKCQQVADVTCDALITCLDTPADQCSPEALCADVVSVSEDWKTCVDLLKSSTCADITEGLPIACIDVIESGGTPAARAAWSVAFSANDPSACTVPAHQATMGTVDANSFGPVVTDGDAGASVSCAVGGTGQLHVDASASQGDSSLHLVIGAIDSLATKAAPAFGSVEFRSLQSAVPFVSGPTACAFYFDGAQQTVAEGKIWVSFACPSISDGTSTCSVTNGVAIFENCAQ